MGRPSKRITRKEAAAILSIPKTSVRNFEKRGFLVPHADRSNCVRYDLVLVTALRQRLTQERLSGKLDGGVISIVFARVEAGRTDAQISDETGLSLAQVADLRLRWFRKRATERPPPTLQTLLTAEQQHAKREHEKQERAKRFAANREEQRKFFEQTLAPPKPADPKPPAEESAYERHRRERHERYLLLRQQALGTRKK